MKKTIQILSSLVGIVFLVSGIGKSVAAHEFSEILVQYGFDALRFFAPPIIIFEIALGLLLVFCIRQKLMSLIAGCFVFGLTVIFLYGHLFVSITDCGCFGEFRFLNTSPLFTYLRNTVLTGILLYIYLKSDNSHKETDANEIIIMACVLCAVCFITGYTFTSQNNSSTQYITKGKQVNVEIENSVLSEVLTLSKDSSYFVYVFSYTCPNCYNSIENLKQYERLGVADKVIAISMESDSLVMQDFNDFLNPNFEILHVSREQIIRIADQVPISFIVRNNVIEMKIIGSLPSGIFLLPQDENNPNNH
jgi:uncharacterized membrane protein YphA (DoxX/SURF4 family)